MSDRWWWHAAVIGAATLVAAISARPYAGGWNDGSRLATVESLVDHGDWSVDRSIFVRPPSGSGPRPFDTVDPSLNNFGTLDLLSIHNRYYSDKSPVPAVIMAGGYAAVQKLTGLTAADSPDRFCLVMTLLSSGLAYVLSVWSVFRLGRPLELALRLRVLLTVGFAVATVALPYAQHVNNHIMLLAVAAMLCVELMWIANGSVTMVRLAGIGLLIGFGYAVDLGVGPVLAVATFGLLVYRLRHRPGMFAAAIVVALPIIGLHHWLNYQIGGTLGPANAVAEYLNWPGSPFTAQSMTGSWRHPSVTRFVLYSLDMIVGKRGILWHDMPLVLGLIAVPMLWRTCRRDRPELLWALGWSVGAWLLYGASSTNSSGVCCSIRWLVPMVASGYLFLAMALRERPEWRGELTLLTAWGFAYCLFLVARGPWREINPLANWLLVAGAMMSWWCLKIVQTQRHGSRSRWLATTSQSGNVERNQWASDSMAKRSVA